MKEFMNYASILGMTDSWSDEKLDQVISEYKQEQEQHRKVHAESTEKHDFFKRNVDGLEGVKERRKLSKIRKQFTLKDEHIKVLNWMYFSLTNGSRLTGVIPSDKEIAIEIGIKAFNQDGDLFEEDQKRVELIVYELQYALMDIIKKFSEDLGIIK